MQVYLIHKYHEKVFLLLFIIIQYSTVQYTVTTGQTGSNVICYYYKHYTAYNNKT